MRSRLLIACLVGATLSVAPGALAQETINTATISGRVVDPDGGVVPAADISVRDTETNVSADARTDAEGRFRFPYLRVGPYELRVRAEGFAEATRTVAAAAGGNYALVIGLTLKTIDAVVEVSANATILEAGRSQIAATVPEPEIQRVPMNGRNFLDLALLVPGVSPTNVASTQLFAETSAVPGAGLSIGSQRNFSNSFIVDGLSANDDAAGLSGIPYGVDAVEQFQVVTSGGQAELGRALGGYVNVVTKSGTNTLHGNVYDYIRDDSLNAANALTGTTLPMHQNQYGGSIGGALIRDRTFYFANAEQRGLDQNGVVTIAPAAVMAINARLAAVGYPGSPIETSTYPNPVDSTNLLAKLDHEVHAIDQASFRYAQYHVTSTNSRGAGGTSAATASADLDNVDRVLSFSNTWTLSSTTVNETRAQLAASDLQAPPSDPVGPAVSIAGVASFGTLSGSPTRRQNTLYEVVDNLSHQIGAHAVRGGVDVLYNDDRITFPRSVRGSYAFSSLANFLSGAYNNAGFTQTFGATVVSQTNPNVGVYVQDEWKATPALTINAGLRYDLQFLETIQTDTNNLAPRAGFAWAPGGSARTIVRGSAGLFFDRVPLRALANALLSAHNTTDLTQLQQTNLGLTPGQAGAPAFPNILSAPVASVTLPNLTTMDPHMQNAYSRQAAIEIERQLLSGLTLSAGYQYTRGEDLIISINQNVPSCVPTGTNNGCRPVSSYGNNSQYSPRATSAYHGLHVSVVERPVRWGSIRVSYTLSKAMDNVGEFFFSSPIDPFDLSKDWSRADDDQRHRLVANAAVNLPFALQASGVVQYYSSLPFNITSGVTTIQGTAGRPTVNGEFIERNAGSGPDFFSVNARLSRMFRIGDRLRLEAIVEGFNLTNRVNVVTVNGNFGAGAYPINPSPTFGQTTAVADPRSAQVAVRASF